MNVDIMSRLENMLMIIFFPQVARMLMAVDKGELHKYKVYKVKNLDSIDSNGEYKCFPFNVN